MNYAQINIIKIVKQYKDVFPQEYIDVAYIARQERNEQKTKFAEMPKASFMKGGGNPFIERALIKWPITLYNLLHMRLSQVEKEYLFNDKSKVGLRWFARKYPEFRIADRI